MPQQDDHEISRARFDAIAANWDANEARRRLSAALATAFERELRARCPEPPDVFDYGCGPGRSILPAAGAFRSVTGCDFSAAMLTEFRRNAAEAGLTHFDTIQCDLCRDPLPQGRYGAVTSAMTLHHVADVPALLHKLASLVLSGGLVALADLECEDGSFHGDMAGVVHLGFDPVWMAAQLESAGFMQVHVRRAVHAVEKPGAGGVMRTFPVFLVSALKS